MKIKSYFFIIIQIYLINWVCISYAENNKTEKNAKKPEVLPNAFSRLQNLQEYYSVFELAKMKESTIAAIIQLKAAQRYGSVLYDQTDLFSVMRFYGFADFHLVMQNRRKVATAVTDSELFPGLILLDVNGRDINAHGLTIIGANISRIGLFFTPFNTGSPENIYGILEFDFSGQVAGTLYGAKIRNTFGELVWGSGSFLFGQFFHPLFLPESFPRTVSTSMGSSFEPQGLVPQMRVTQMLGDFELIFSLASEGYIESWGPQNDQFFYLANSNIPDILFQLKWRWGHSFIGAAINYKRLVPRLVSNTNYKVNEHIDSVIAEAFIHNVFSWGELNFKVVYAQNGSDQLLISGFGIRTSEPITNFQTYSNTAALSAWMDTFCVFYYGTMSVGLFVAGVKNLGSRHALFIAPGATQPTVYTIEQMAQFVLYNIDFSPRFLYAWGAFRFGFEFTWTNSAFGMLNRFAQVINAKPVNFFATRFSLNYVF